MKFRSKLELGGKTATGFEVPAKVVESLGSGKRPAVRVTINGHTYRSTVATFFGGLSYRQRRWFVEGIEAAKKPETRQRRIDDGVARLREGRGAR